MYNKLFALILSLILFSCSALMEDTKNKSSDNSLKKTSSNLRAVINNARYDLDNIHLYQNTKEYTGSIIATRGYFVEQKLWKDKDKKFIISGSNTGYAGEFVVYLDHPLQQQTRIGENIQIISTSSSIRVFGKFKGLEEYLTSDGVKKTLPILEAIVIYNYDDRELKNPVWVNRLYD